MTTIARLADKNILITIGPAITQLYAEWREEKKADEGSAALQKRAVFLGPTGVLLQMSDIKLIPNAPKEKNNDR